MDANLWFSDHNGLPKTSVNRNQAGLSFGGPLEIPRLYKQRDKTYFFGLYEHFGASTPSVGTFTVPNSNFRGGDFSQLLGAQVGTDALGRPIYSGQIYDPRSGRAITAGVVDPVTGLVPTSSGYIRDPIANNNVAAFRALDPVATKLLTYFPSPTNSALANNLTVDGQAPAGSNEYTMRVDRNISDNSRVYVRYSYKEEYKTGEPDYYGTSDPGGPGVYNGDNRYDIVAGYSHAFNQNLVLDVTVGQLYTYGNQIAQSLGFQPSSLGLPSYLDQYPQFPTINFGGASSLGNGGHNKSRSGSESVAADLTRISGKHTETFGFMGVQLADDQITNYTTTIDANGSFTCGPDPTLCTSNTGNGVAQALLGLPDGGSTGVAWSPSLGIKYLGWYMQDDWRPTPKLTMNLGLRYEIQTAPTYKNNEAAVFDPTIPNPIGSEVGSLGILPGVEKFLSSGQRGSYDTNYTNLAPRIGFSYRALPKLVVRGGYGIFFPPSISIFKADSNGYAATTSVVASLNNGINPATGLSLADPWPNGYVAVSGNSLGELQDVGYNTSSNFSQRPSTYIQQYLFGLQYGLGQNDSLEVDYVGNAGDHILSNGLTPSQLNPAYLSLGPSVLNQMVANPFYGHIASGATACGMDQPTIVYSHLLQPMPQFCSVSEQDPPVGFSRYNALEATYNHRFSKGLNVLVSYTFSKFLDNVEGNQNWSYTGNSSVANNYNLAAEKSVDGDDTPQSLVVSYIYDLPVGRGKAIGSGLNRKTDAVLGGWEISGIVTSKSGIPIGVNGNNINSYGGDPRPDVIATTHASHQGVEEWFNTGAFAYAPYGTFGTAPRWFSNMRAPDYNNFDTGIMKNWALPESMRIQFRAEMFNTFNHPQFYSPNGSYSGCDPNSNTSCLSSFGQITSAFPGRQVQMSGKFYW